MGDVSIILVRQLYFRASGTYPNTNECGKMANIYRHVLCTIAATGSSDVDGGCFIDRVGL
jgi:hypothetical protein